MIEADPSITNPDHTWRHILGDVGLCPKLSPCIVNLDLVATGYMSRISVGPGYPKLRRSAGTTLAAAPVVAGDGDAARIAAWLGGYATERQVRLYLPLLWPITMALVGGFFWGTWGLAKSCIRSKSAPTVTARNAEPIPAPVDMLEVPITVLPGDVRRFVLACLPRAQGRNEPLTAIYRRYCRWCDDTKATPLGATEFAGEFKRIAWLKSTVPPLIIHTFATSWPSTRKIARLSIFFLLNSQSVRGLYG